MTPERFARIRSVLNQRQPDLTVVTDEVHKGRNLAAIVRSCDAIGIGKIHCVMPQEGYQTYSGTAASADKWVDVVHHSTISQPLEDLKTAGYQIVAANKSAQARHFRDIDYLKPTALVLGAEVKGVSDHATRVVDHEVYVPMVGMVESFNVSVACATILMEVQRQRELAGYYESVRLAPDEWQSLFFRWAHPAIAEYCHKYALAYPPVNPDDGEIINAAEWYRQVSQNS